MSQGYFAIKAAGLKNSSVELESVVEEHLGLSAQNACLLPDDVHPLPHISEKFGEEIMHILSAKFRGSSTVYFFGDSSLCSVTEDGYSDRTGWYFRQGASKNFSGNVNLWANWGRGVRDFSESIQWAAAKGQIVAGTHVVVLCAGNDMGKLKGSEIRYHVKQMKRTCRKAGASFDFLNVVPKQYL